MFRSRIRFKNLVSKLAVETHHCHVRIGTQPKSSVFGAGKFGCAARFSPHLKTGLTLLLMLPPSFGDFFLWLLLRPRKIGVNIGGV